MSISAILYKIFLLVFNYFPFKKEACTLLKKINLKIDKYYKDIRFHGVFNVKHFI